MAPQTWAALVLVCNQGVCRYHLFTIQYSHSVYCYSSFITAMGVVYMYALFTIIMQV